MIEFIDICRDIDMALSGQLIQHFCDKINHWNGFVLTHGPEEAGFRQVKGKLGIM